MKRIVGHSLASIELIVTIMMINLPSNTHPYNQQQKRSQSLSKEQDTVIHGRPGQSTVSVCTCRWVLKVEV